MIDWNKDGVFSPEFGDWDKGVVVQEQIDSYDGETHKIITSLEPITREAINGEKIHQDINEMVHGEELKGIRPSRKKTKVFAVHVTSEVERVVYVKANTAKQAENLIEECGYVEGENEFAETLMDEGGNIGATHLMNEGDGYKTREVEAQFGYRCNSYGDCNGEKAIYTYYTDKKEEGKSV
jgi:hypothetical protein